MRLLSLLRWLTVGLTPLLNTPFQSLEVGLTFILDEHRAGEHSATRQGVPILSHSIG